MRVWVDLTNAPHAVTLAPLVRALERRGDEVLTTARDYGQTVELARRLDLDPVVVGHHGGRGRAGKARAAAGRVDALRRWAARARPDAAFGHGSTEQPVVARLLGIPATTMLDYEWASVQHGLNCRLTRRTLAPEAIPASRMARLGAHGAKLVRFPGLKEEYALADLEPDPAVADGFRGGQALLAVLRPPPELALYHRVESPLFGQVLERLSGHGDVVTVVLPRIAEQGARIAALALPRVVVPETRRRRPEPDRVRRRRRLGGRHHEPRGGRARHPGLHDLRRASRRRRRAAPGNRSHAPPRAGVRRDHRTAPRTGGGTGTA